MRSQRGQETPTQCNYACPALPPRRSLLQLSKARIQLGSSSLDVLPRRLQRVHRLVSRNFPEGLEVGQVIVRVDVAAAGRPAVEEETREPSEPSEPSRAHATAMPRTACSSTHQKVLLLSAHPSLSSRPPNSPKDPIPHRVVRVHDEVRRRVVRRPELVPLGLGSHVDPERVST
jgi:hypothetical protein